MASVVFASSPFSAQSLVKLRTNSNYPHSSCYVPSPSREKNSYVHLSCKNISYIESSKSSFTKGDGNFSFSLPKFPRVASTLSPSLNIIKAYSGEVNIYHFKAHSKKPREYIQLSDRYKGTILLIVNIPQKDSNWAKSEIKFLNYLRRLYEGKASSYGKGFEVLGFLHDKNELSRKSEEGEIPMGEEEILEVAEFPIFEKVKVNDKHPSFWRSTFIPDLIEKEINDDLWYFLRNTPMDDNSEKVEIINEEFEKFLVDGTGKPVHHWPRIPVETVKDVKGGQNPGNISSNLRVIDPNIGDIIESRIDEYFRKL